MPVYVRFAATAKTLARCISMASPDLWPRWGRAVGIWAQRSQEARDRETDPRQSRCGMSWHVVEHWENIAGGFFALVQYSFMEA